MVAFENHKRKKINATTYTSQDTRAMRVVTGYLTKLTSCLVVRAGNNAGDQGYGDDAEADNLEQKVVRKPLASGDGLK